MANNIYSSSANFSPSSEKFLNNFYKPGFTINSLQNDAVTSYFEGITNNKDSAKILASSVVYTSIAQGIDPLIVLDQLKNMIPEDRAKFMSMFLNFNRVGSSQLGIRSQKKYASYIERLINPPPSSYADGLTPERAARNALAIKELNNELPNGFYWVKGYNDNPMQVYCDMNGSEAGSPNGGWMRFDNALVHRYRTIAINESMRGFIYNTSLNGAYNSSSLIDGQLRGIVWDLGPFIKFSGVRIKRVKFNCVGGQDGYYTYDAPQPNWGTGLPTDEMVTSYIDNSYILGNNFHSYGWSVGNGRPGVGNLVRLYKKAPVAEWPAQFSGLVTLSEAAFYQYNSTDLATGRYIYYYESDSIGEFNNLIDYTIWLR